MFGRTMAVCSAIALLPAAATKTASLRGLFYATFVLRMNTTLALIALLALSVAAQAEIYRWVDDLGNIVYSQALPPDARDVDTVVIPPPPRLEHPPEERRQQAADNPGLVNPALDDATRKAYCEIGKRNLELLGDSTDTSLFRTQSGEIARYTAEEIAMKINESRAVIKAYCD